PSPHYSSMLSLHDALPILLSGEDEFRELRRACHIRPFADVDEAQIRPERQRFEAAQPEVRLRTRNLTRLQAANRFGNRFDMRRRSEEHTSELQSPDHLVCR